MLGFFEIDVEAEVLLQVVLEVLLGEDAAVGAEKDKFIQLVKGSK